MLRLLTIPALALLSATPVAACPTELGPGIVVVSDDGGVSRITPTDRPGLLHERVTFDDGYGFEILSFHGIYIVGQVDFGSEGMIEDSRETAEFAQTPPPPEAGQRLQGIMAQVVRDGRTESRRHDIEVGQPETMQIGDCGYRALPVTLDTFDEHGPGRTWMAWLPDLEVALFVGYADRDGEERYTILSIEAHDPATSAP